jgi:hypothetical protein
MKFNLPKKTTFWVAIIIATVGVIVYVVHLVVTDLLEIVVGYLQPAAILLVVIAFVLLCLGLTVKGL